jgi:hypothetical protein
MGVRSLGNALAGFGYKFGRTGLDAVGAPPPGGPTSATGGDVTYTYGTKKIHVFTSPGTLSNDSGSQIVAEYFLVGGGGGSAGDAGGGGGAGGVVTTIPGIMPVTATPLTLNNGTNVSVTIGAGGGTSGAGQPDSPAYPGGSPLRKGNGTDTFFAGPAGNSTRALGGGGGGAESNTGPSNLPVTASSGGKGGSGGGSRANISGSANTPGLSNQGNTGNKSQGWLGGGPGGVAGGAGGGAGGNATGVDGGVGVQLPSDYRDNTQPSSVKGDPGTYGGATAPTPGGWWFAGGGGAWTNNDYPVPTGVGGPSGQGGSGGGGQGGNAPLPQAAQNGQANTGGGAGSDSSTGGSGIAFFSYPIA